MRHTMCVAPRALDFNPVTTRRLAHFRDPLKCATRRVWILVPQITSRFAFVSAFVRIATRRLAHLRYAQPPHPLYVNDVSFIYPMQSQGNNIVSPRRSTHVTPAVHFTVVHTQYDICHFTHSSQLLYEVLTTGYRWAFATCRCTPCTPHIPEALWNRTSCCCHFMSDSIHVSLSHPSPVGHWLGTDWKRLTLDLCVPSTSLSLSNGTSQHQPPSSTSPASPSRPVASHPLSVFSPSCGASPYSSPAPRTSFEGIGPMLQGETRRRSFACIHRQSAHLPFSWWSLTSFCTLHVPFCKSSVIPLPSLCQTAHNVRSRRGAWSRGCSAWCGFQRVLVGLTPGPEGIGPRARSRECWASHPGCPDHDRYPVPVVLVVVLCSG